jgi:ADP-dependent phosphofructokinase/glucokinase
MRVICGYNVNIDAVHNISGDEISRLIEDFDLRPKIGLREKIGSLEDLVSGLLFCMRSGSGAELLIDDPEVAGLIGKTFAWQNRLGGNAGNMANVLAQLGAEPVLNVPALTSRQASFLHSGVRVAKSDRLQPAALAAKEGKDLTHFVFQFSAGEKVATAEEIVVSPQENRFIASFDSLNRRLYTDPDFDSYCREHLDEIKGALIAGFHLVSFPCLEES